MIYMPAHDIAKKYEKIRSLLKTVPLSDGQITDLFIEINDLCATEIGKMTQVPITSNTTAKGKNYIVFSVMKAGKPKYSRPVNIDIYNSGSADDSSIAPPNPPKKKVAVFWENLKAGKVQAQSADDITSALYVIAMNYCCCADLVDGVKSNSGDYFEKLVGHLYSVHLGVVPTKQMNAVELDGESISLPTDYIFDMGAGRPKYHVPVKTSTRERCVEVWAQQRILDGAFGVGRFLCLLTCIGETNFYSKSMSVDITCVPNQWVNYQLFVSQIKRAYYLDVPDKYDELNKKFPRITVKKFGEFFHESATLYV